VRWESLRNNLSICTFLANQSSKKLFIDNLPETSKTREDQICVPLTQVFERICGWSTELSSWFVPSQECLVMTGSRICKAALWRNREGLRQRILCCCKHKSLTYTVNLISNSNHLLQWVCVCVWHTVGAWGLLALFYQQACNLGVRGGVGWIIRAHYHPDEGGSATREVTLNQSKDKDSDPKFVWNQSCRSPLLQSFLPGTGPACLYPALMGLGGRRGASGTSPPHWSPGMTEDHRLVSETLGPSHTADPCSHCYTAPLCRSTWKRFDTFNKSCGSSLVSTVTSHFRSYLQYFCFLIERSTQQTNDFPSWHEGMLNAGSQHIQSVRELKDTMRLKK